MFSKGFFGLTVFTLSQTTNFRIFQTDTDDNFKFDENSRKFSKKDRKRWEKREIARSPFPLCLQKTCTADI